MAILSTTEAAAKLGVSSRRVRALIAAGKLAARQLGREYAIEETALESVQTYGKSGRPAKAETANGTNGINTGESELQETKPFKTIFDVCPEFVGSVSSGITDLSTNKKYLDDLGAKSAGRIIKGQTKGD